MFGPLCTSADGLLLFIWIIYRTEETYEAHSGYSFYNTFLHKIGLTHSTGALFHDFHHSRNFGNFGFEQIDFLFGTDKGWKQWLDKYDHDRS